MLSADRARRLPLCAARLTSSAQEHVSVPIAQFEPALPSEAPSRGGSTQQQPNRHGRQGRVSKYGLAALHSGETRPLSRLTSLSSLQVIHALIKKQDLAAP